MSRWHSRYRRIDRVCMILFLLSCFGIFAIQRQIYRSKLQQIEKLSIINPDDIVERGLVMAARPDADVSWILELNPKWTPYIYSASDSSGPAYIRIAEPRGREAMAYLTFIIDHYDSLPAVTAFVHAAPTQWHNDMLGPYTTDILQHLRLDSVERLGYVNLRCSNEPGCPLAVIPFEPTQQDIKDDSERAHFPEIYMELLGVDRMAVPSQIGGVCCGQFAISAERIRKRPRTDYERMRTWIKDGSLNVTDSFGVGWVFEKIWHVIFGMESVYCPSLEQCRCDLFGWCSTECPAEYVKLRKSAHPWLGSRFGEKYGNTYAVGVNDA